MFIYFGERGMEGDRKRRRDGKREGERETLMCERNMGQLPLIFSPTRDPTHNLGMCPNQELNPQRFSA